MKTLIAAAAATLISTTAFAADIISKKPIVRAFLGGVSQDATLEQMGLAEILGGISHG